MLQTEAVFFVFYFQIFMASSHISLNCSDSSDSSGSHSSYVKRKRRVRERAEDDEDDEDEGDDVEIEIIENPPGRSYVWLHFRKIKKTIYGMKNGKRVIVNVIEKAECVHCGTKFASCSTAHGTSTLKRHVDRVCKEYEGRLRTKGEQPATRGAKGRERIKWTQQGCREAAVKMIVMDELPFSFIEKEGFRYFCRYAVPDWEVPSRRVIVKQFLSMYKEEKAKLRNEMKGHCLSLTTDTWTSVQNINYMVVTAHFVDSGWNMQKRILSFKVIPNHQGTSIGKLLEDCLLEWEVQRVLTISVDNASANKVAVDYIREKMLGWETRPIL